MTTPLFKYYVHCNSSKDNYEHEHILFAKDLDSALIKAERRFNGTNYEVVRVRPDELYNSSIKNKNNLSL